MAACVVDVMNWSKQASISTVGEMMGQGRPGWRLFYDTQRRPGILVGRHGDEPGRQNKHTQPCGAWVREDAAETLRSTRGKCEQERAPRWGVRGAPGGKKGG